ncbi:GFA family protein [Ralstonia syzygii]|uniref:CENP-V/GFA domain-containing protein n=1 Tax=Ralstonia solanacearum TaxID=305 RepID=A0AAD0WG01_RALSL|nr:hypothetical protein CJO76_08225 [Ralstonia solanacearum]CBM10145.1 hypothethical protein [Ralstonia solanacearum PSI07]AXV81513.1 hypothetical protein CJO77_08090 [Ralstonia solanacearum]AXV86397.1 hypothetical protein CJO78_08800 [Ralstonia solanacearum]AXV90974.1 hypothetical protein CJO79_08205 [Ralstonia solanacearum]
MPSAFSRTAGRDQGVYVCHCTMCQRRTGGAALPVMWVRRTDPEILEGHAPLAEFDLGNGHNRRARICPRCDTR